MAHQSDIRYSEGVRAIPEELLGFFLRKQGRVLLVRGDPGAGKTLFAVRTLDVLRQRGGDVLYVSTRVDTETVYRNYLAGTTGLTGSSVLDISQDPFDADISPSAELGTDEFDPTAFLEWLQAVGEVSDPLTVVFDSWELVQRYLRSRGQADDPMEPETLVTRIAALARQHGLRVVLVTEHPEQTSLDYVVDGVVELQVDHGRQGRPERTLVLEKLRGVRIGNRTRPFTLSEGRFSVFRPVNLPFPRSNHDEAEYQSLPDTKTKFSTGIADLDTMLDGGYNRGSIVHFALGPDISRDAWSLPCLATARNFLSGGKGVATVPLPESSPGLVRRNLEPICPNGSFDARCEVFETYDHEPTAPTEADRTGRTDRGASASDDESPRGLGYSAYLQRVESIREASDGPLLHVISMDAAGDAFGDVLSDHATYVALHNDLSILVTKPGGEERTRANRIADVHLRLERRGETVFLYGENPVTPFLGFDTRATDSDRNLALQEMV
ncbi:MAG: gas vesicle protein GvpD basic region 2 domain-containing protein [Haloglomus sp.]